jgi:hypothetical protein
LRGGAANSDVRGYYGSLGYLFTPKIEGVFRYDSFDSARSVPMLKCATSHGFELLHQG